MKRVNCDSYNLSRCIEFAGVATTAAIAQRRKHTDTDTQNQEGSLPASARQPDR